MEKKVSRLDKYFDEDAVCSVYLKTEGKRSKTELTIYYKGNMIRAEVSGENFYDNIDAVLPKIERQIYKHKSKLESKLKKDAFEEKQLFFREEILPQEGKLVKTKTFTLTPMTTEEEPLGMYLNREVMEDLEEKCKSLKPPYDAVALAYYYEGKSAEEIAALENRNKKTIQTQIYRARDMLKKMYGKERAEYG